MKTPTASSATSSQREQTSLISQMPRSPRSNVCSTPDPENPSVSVHRKRFSTPSLTLKFLCAGKLNLRGLSVAAISYYVVGLCGYLIKAAHDAGILRVDPSYATAAVVPLAVLAIWLVVRRIRRRHIRTTE